MGDRGWRRFKAVTGFMARNGKRVLISIAGLVVIAAGLVLSLPLVPGPGVIVIIGGLAILATEYAWARRALDKAKEKAKQALDKARGRTKRGDGASGSADDGART